MDDKQSQSSLSSGYLWFFLIKNGVSIFTDFFDAYGLIGHLTPSLEVQTFDFGDSCREWGSFAFIMAYLRSLEEKTGHIPNSSPAHFVHATGMYEIGFNIYCRHPKSPTLWHRDPNEFSRDQQTALECAFALHKMNRQLKGLYVAQMRRFGKYQNKDFRTWEWGFALRFLRWWWAWPVIAILDIGLLIGSIIRVISFRISIEDSGDHINHSHLLIICNDIYPTPLSLLAKKIYTLFVNAQDAWDFYYRHPENPPQNEIIRPVLAAKLAFRPMFKRKK